MALQYIDSHAHLFFNDYKDDLDKVLDRARSAGVIAIVVPGTDLQSSRDAVDLADRYSEIFAAVGFHPHDASKATEKALSDIESLSKHAKVVAIGEIGLDYHYNFSPRERQKEIFSTMLELAVQRNLPAIVHTRESFEDAFSAVKDVVTTHDHWLKSEGLPQRGVFHCFPGTSVDAMHLRQLGFWVSYTGNVTFKKSSVKDVVKEIGVQNILLETDSPYMTPVPFRGKRNEPAYVALIAKDIAETLHLSEEEVAQVATRNTIHALNLKIRIDQV